MIYADDKPSDIQRFSDQLERFHSAMALLLQSRALPPSPSNRVTVYVVKNDKEVRKLAGDRDKFVYAFYQPRAGGSFAIVPTVNATSGTPDFSMIALLHEYAHHFQLSTARFPWPRWFVEGSAEFFASAKFERNGVVMLGMAAQHRLGELLYADDVTAAQLLDPDSYDRKERKTYDAYYGKAWLLYHYLTFTKDRPGQFERYLKLLQEGRSSAEAARTTFGDLAQLERDLQTYLKQRTITAWRVPPESIEPGPVVIRELGAGEAAMMPIRIRSRRGVTAEQADEFLPQARAVAASFPADASVLAALAEAEHDADHDKEAIAAADAALAIDPKQMNAYVQKGLSLFRLAEDAPDKAAAYRAARAPFLALNQLENDHPLPLMYYYLAYDRQNGRANATAVQALDRASELAPFDVGLRYLVIRQALQDKQFGKAIAHLTPIAFDPHGGSGSGKARKLLDRLKSDEGLDSADPASLLAILSEPDVQVEQGQEGVGEDDAANVKRRERRSK